MSGIEVQMLVTLHLFAMGGTDGEFWTNIG